MLRHNEVQDRLYLSQGDENIYIDNCRVPQHHIEGIRFLYRQFKRHRKGVVINDPFSFGRNIQILLFLKAVRPLLKRSVLILCQEGSEETWLDRFLTWTDLYDDVVIETTSPTFKRLITINAMVNLPVFCAHEWSIVIVDGENNAPTNLILKLPFRADFKIWNTSVNMKKDLNKFAEIYRWLFPEETFDKDYFMPNAESAVDVIDKAILLDSFMEDIVLRREDLDSSFEKYHRDIIMPPSKATPAPLPPPTPTRKNKDAGGTKIKRSKKTVTVHNKNQTNTPPTAASTPLIGETSKPCEIFDSTEDFSIDNYKRKMTENSGNINETNESPFKIIEIDSSEQHSDMKLYYESDSITGTRVHELEEMDTLVFGHDTFIDKLSPDNKEFECDKDGTESAKVVTTSKLTIEDKDNSKTDSSQTSGENSKNVDILKGDKNETVSNISKDITDESLKGLQKENVSKMNFDELNKEISHLDTKHYSEEITTQKNGQDKINTDSQQIKSTDQAQINTNKENNKSDTKDTQQNTLKRNNIDERMKEYEEKVSKKFKGSLLDSLF